MVARLGGEPVDQRLGGADAHGVELGADGLLVELPGRGQGEGERNKVFAEAFGKDASFYDFYRAMQSYDSTFSPAREGEGPKGDSNIILSPDNEYLRQFRGEN